MSTKTEDTVSTVAVELSEKRNAKDEKETSAKRVKGFHIGHAGGAYSLGLKGEYIHTPGDVFNGKPVFRKFWGFPPVQQYMYYTENNKWMATDRRKDFSIGAGLLLSKQQCCPSPLEVEDWTIYDKAEKKWKVEHDFELTVHEHHLKLCGMCENENDDEVEYIKGNLFELRTEYKSIFDGNTDLCEHCWNKLDVEKKKQYAKIETPKDLPEFGWTDPARRREIESSDSSFTFFVCLPEEWKLCPYPCPSDTAFCLCGLFECMIRLVLYHIFSALFIPPCFLLRLFCCNVLGCKCEEDENSDDDVGNVGDEDGVQTKVSDDKDVDQTKDLV